MGLESTSDLLLEHLEKAVKRWKKFYFRILFSAIKCQNFSSVKFLSFAMYVPLRPIGQVNKKLSSNYRQINLENTVIRSIKVIRKVGGGSFGQITQAVRWFHDSVITIRVWTGNYLRYFSRNIPYIWYCFLW